MPSRLLGFLPSMRLTLVLYFLVVLGTALGIVSFLCYESTQEALAEKEASTKKLFQSQFEDNKAHVEADHDSRLLDRAQGLGKRAILHQHRIEPLNILQVLGTALTPGGLSNLLPIAETNSRQLTPILGQSHLDIRIQHREDEGAANIQPYAVDEGRYFQTYTASKNGSWPLESSDTLGGVTWTMDSTVRARLDEGASFVYDTVDVHGKAIRRVAVKLPVQLTVRGFFPDEFLRLLPKSFEKGPPPLRPGDLPRTGDAPRTINGRKPAIYLQYAEEPTRRDSQLAAFKLARDKNIADLTEQLDESRAQLKRRLFWVAIGVFLAALLGGLALVHRSLAPLKELSEAVSMVSEKDFRLPLGPKRLPRELVPIADRLTQTLDQLKRAFEREKQAAADISHELRTPVAALLTTLEIALRKPRSANEYREVLEDCKFNGQQIHLLVERLLTLARLDAGADLLRTRDVDVKALTTQCLALVRPLADARGLKLNANYEGESLVLADPDKLREVLTNLLHNAIEYNKPDGSVDVKVARNNGTLDVEVSDTGIGIAPEVRQHIFERFYRADPSRHSDSPHAGLGLAIVKGYVELMGGAIDVKSCPGVGSTFRVRLPSHN